MVKYSIAVTVAGGPKNMYISPDQADYDVGTTLTCFADAFPQATIYWQNLDTAEIWNSQSFVIRADLVGTNRFRCHAENYINGILYYNDIFNVIVVNRTYAVCSFLYDFGFGSCRFTLPQPNETS
jgi:hypothetical protein